MSLHNWELNRKILIQRVIQHAYYEMEELMDYWSTWLKLSTQKSENRDFVLMYANSLAARTKHSVETEW